MSIVGDEDCSESRGSSSRIADCSFCVFALRRSRFTRRALFDLIKVTVIVIKVAVMIMIATPMTPVVIPHGNSLTENGFDAEAPIIVCRHVDIYNADWYMQ